MGTVTSGAVKPLISSLFRPTFMLDIRLRPGSRDLSSLMGVDELIDLTPELHLAKNMLRHRRLTMYITWETTETWIWDITYLVDKTPLQIIRALKNKLKLISPKNRKILIPRIDL